MDHQDDVKYRAEHYIEFGDEHRDGWTSRQRGDGTFEASGPCPECKGSAYGPRAAVIDWTADDVGDEVADVAPPELGADVVCECHCGVDHGKGSDLGCGRWWIYPVVSAGRGAT